MGADPEAGGVRNRKPLYTALVSRNEEVARILFDETSNMDISIAEPEQDQTALHVACYCRLLESIQYFLERGANVNRITSQASTPLDLILRSSNSNPGYSLSENDFKIVLLLLEFGTKLSEKTCMYGLKHPDRRVRGLFQTSGTVKDTGKRVLIGRSWMASSAEFDPNELYGSSGINRGRSQPASQDTQQSVDETFPALNHSSQPNEPAQRHEWTPSKVQRIIADFSNAKRPLRVGPLPRDPFPKLGPLEISTRTSAGDLWRTFRGQ
ncbi:hypothetical protein EV356DRAFT_501140 [Viridothelium virens]|uniref:Uncharacterized protein n=1 Tax=Viridothelium virens TaxID=1048519 RepID=A0A6A6H9R5_VIRVR|nr:hypothetical protein EV356DRAFT_501140 [Viridothelium virens]